MYDGSLDSIVGVLNVRDLFKARSEPEAFELRALLRTTLFVPETRPADDLLQALVGRIEQEPPLGSQLLPPSPAQLDADGSWVMDGLLRLAEFEEITGVHLPESAHAEVETLGGLVMAVLDRLPAVGDQLLISHRVLRVEQLDGKRVARLRLLPPGGSVAEVAVASSRSSFTS